MSESDQGKAERLAAALRENLRKRKAQARAHGASVPAEAGTQDQKSEPTQPAKE